MEYALTGQIYILLPEFKHLRSTLILRYLPKAITNITRLSQVNPKLHNYTVRIIIKCGFYVTH